MSTTTNRYNYDRIIYIDQTTKYFTDISDLKQPLGKHAIIPSKSIIYKTLPGLGATYCEIISERNSIVVLPNVSAVKNKHKAHQEADFTFAVYEGVNTEQIVKYLKKRGAERRKLLVVPESFIKVKRALKRLNHNFSDYFLLLDECHKYCTDVGYRGTITDIIDDLFDFENSAMISATPIPPSDPRFLKHRFKNLKLQPIYAYKYQIDLTFTSNIIESVRNLLSELESEHCYIFFNSIEGIKSVISHLKLQGEAAIYCSKESKKLLSSDGFKNVFDTYDNDLVPSRFNFLTSSFFNGLDILIDTKPEVVIITDPYNAEHTMVDPLTDVIQILGRTRKGYSKATHFVKTARKQLNFLTEEEANMRIEVSKDIFDSITRLQNLANPGVQASFYEGLKLRIVPYSNLLNCNGSFNHFKKDNYCLEEKIKGYYSNTQNLLNAYHAADHFVFRHTQTTEIDTGERLNFKGNRYSQLNYFTAIKAMLDLEVLNGHEVYDEAVYELSKSWPEAVEAYYTLPIEKFIELRFKRRLIKQAVIKEHARRGKNSHALIDAVYNAFSLGKTYDLAYVKDKLTSIYLDLGHPASAKATDLKLYYEVKECKKTGKDKKQKLRAYRLIRNLHAEHPLYKRK